jgi:hypothetical protein
MTIPEIINILQNKIAGLEKQKKSAAEAGELAEVVRYQNEIVETKATLIKLETIELE